MFILAQEKILSCLLATVAEVAAIGKGA